MPNPNSPWQEDPGAGGSAPVPTQTSLADRRVAQQTGLAYDQGLHPQSGIAVGGWVPFANYLNTQSNRGVQVDQPKEEAPQEQTDPGPAKTPGPGAPGTSTPGLVGGPGLGGYYGQLSQQYLTGRR